MCRNVLFHFTLALLIGGCFAIALPAGLCAADFPGLGDPGNLAAISIDQPHDFPLRGRDARRQLIVTGKYDSGQSRDLTSHVTYRVAPSGVIQIDSGGFVVPLANGKATVTAQAGGGKSTTCELTVVDFDKDVPINFANQITPIFTKLGCNSGGCHGKSTGQNGFKLSLLGFYPKEDYEFLVKEARGRRIFPAAPERSLLLMKAANKLAHGGGQRMSEQDYQYQIIRSWIGQGMPYGSEDDPTVAGLEVFPAQRLMARGGEQQLAIYARYTDGSIQDVTRMASLEANNPEMAETTSTGMVRTLDVTGEAAVMVRFQGQVAVFRATIPMGVKVENLPKPRNLVDELVFAKLEELGIPPSPVCNDATFIRRSYLDLTGALPSAEEARAFLESTDPAKRDRLIDDLLASGAHADFFTNKWSAILRNRNENNNFTRGTYAFHDWIRDSIRKNMPYDEFVRGIVAASGDVSMHPPVAWYRALNTPLELAEDTAQLFLGLRIQCARCHHHPFERWSQSDYYSFQAFFTQVGRKNGLNGLRVQDEPRIYHKRGVGKGRNPRTGEQLDPAGLGGEPVKLNPDQDPRMALVDWMADPKNPFFAQALVNRYWKHFFGRGIVDPEDDMRVTNPPTNPALLKGLAQRFVDSGFDTRDLIRTICQSRVYQLDSEPNAYNENDKQNYSRYYAKRLQAEVLYDALNKVTASSTNFRGLPNGSRAVQLPDQNVSNYFLTVFGKPQGASPCECERSADANLAQILHMLNSNEVQGKLTSGSGRAAQLAAQKERSHEERIRELYFWVYSRPPVDEEMNLAVSYIQRKENVKEAYEDLIWALVNTKEFLFNH